MRVFERVSSRYETISRGGGGGYAENMAGEG